MTTAGGITAAVAGKALLSSKMGAALVAGRAVALDALTSTGVQVGGAAYAFLYYFNELKRIRPARPGDSWTLSPNPD
jgi:hypothetical protein